VRALSLCLLLLAGPALAQVPVARVAREGLPAPGRNGHHFVSFAEATVGDLGDMAFAAFTRDGDGEAERGLWHMTPDGRLTLIAYEGQLANVGNETVTLHSLGAPFLTADGVTAWASATVDGQQREGILLFDEHDERSFLGGTFPVFPALPVARDHWVSPDHVHLVIEHSAEGHRALRYNRPSRSWIDGASLDVGTGVADAVTVHGITGDPRRIIAFVDTAGDTSGLYAFDIVNDEATPLMLEAQLAPLPWQAHRLGRPDLITISDDAGLLVRTSPVPDAALGTPSAPICPLGAVFLLGVSSSGAPALTHLCDTQAPTADGEEVVLVGDAPLAYIDASYALFGRAGDEEVVLRNGVVHARAGRALEGTGLVPSALTQLGDSLAGPTLLEVVDETGRLAWTRHRVGEGWDVLVREADVVHPGGAPIATFVAAPQRQGGEPPQSNSIGQAALRAVDGGGLAQLLMLDSEALTGLNEALRLTSSLDASARPGFAEDAAIPLTFSVEALEQPLTNVAVTVRVVDGTFTALPQTCQPLDDNVSALRCALDNALLAAPASVALDLRLAAGGLVEVSATGTRAGGTVFEAARRWQLLDEASADLLAFPSTIEVIGPDSFELGMLVDNRGPSRATNVRLTCSVFDGVLVTPVIGAGDCEPVINQLGSVWTCDLGSLEPLGSRVATVRLDNLPPMGDAVVACDVTSSVFDPVASNNIVEFAFGADLGDGEGAFGCDGLCGENDGNGDDDGGGGPPPGGDLFGLPLLCDCVATGADAPPPAAAMALWLLSLGRAAHPRRRRRQR
jgi:hypothetical protein